MDVTAIGYLLGIGRGLAEYTLAAEFNRWCFSGLPANTADEHKATWPDYCNCLCSFFWNTYLSKCATEVDIFALAICRR